MLTHDIAKSSMLSDDELRFHAPSCTCRREKFLHSHHVTAQLLSIAQPKARKSRLLRNDCRLGNFIVFKSDLVGAKTIAKLHRFVTINFSTRLFR
jgi:hypothetical protein